MYWFLCRRRLLFEVLASKSAVPYSSTTWWDLSSSLSVFHSSRLLFFSAKSFSTETNEVKAERKEEFSFTVSYLINSCGLSPDVAKSVCRRVELGSEERPDSVLKILRNYGFRDAHIARLIRIRPRFLLADPDRIILPKLKFFRSIGVADAELVKICSSSVILGVSLNNAIIPNYNFLKEILLSDENVAKAFRRTPRIFQMDLQRILSPKLEVFRELGMPESFFSLILTCYASIVLQNRDKFDERLKKVIGMGFDPRRTKFIHAMYVFVSKTPEALERKVEVYKRWGWSEADIKVAFKRYPTCMSASEKKINNIMNFLVNEMGWHPTDTAAYPEVFLFNYEKRVMPRCSVIKFLQSKGLIEEKLGLVPILQPTESLFLDRFVTRYLDKVPQLLKIYHNPLKVVAE